MLRCFNLNFSHFVSKHLLNYLTGCISALVVFKQTYEVNVSLPWGVVGQALNR